MSIMEAAECHLMKYRSDGQFSYHGIIVMLREMEISAYIDKQPRCEYMACKMLEPEFVQAGNIEDCMDA